MIQFNKISIIRFLHNLYRHFVYDEIEIFGSKSDVERMSEEIKCIKRQLDHQKLVNNIIVDSIENKDNTYIDELKYLIDNGYSNFPYKQVKECPLPQCGFDEIRKLPFVYHGDKKMYFSSDLTPVKSAEMYKYYIERENLLGGGYTEKAPHQYQTDSFKIEESDVLVDLGCAEALLSLDVIEKVKHVYLVEGDNKWIPALEATFEPYKEKVTIINKFVSDIDDEKNVRLETMLHNVGDSPLFIKMDIEGAEVKVLGNSSDFLKNKKNVKIACCTYHHNDDFNCIVNIINGMGYHYSVSEGHMLFSCYDESSSPFFRKGLVRVNN